MRKFYLNEYVGTVIDECDDSSVDTNLWSYTATGVLGGSSSEDGIKAIFTSSQDSSGANHTITVRLDQVNAPSIESTNDLYVIEFERTLSSNSDSGKVGIGGDTTTINLASTTANTKHTMIIKFLGSNKCYVWLDGDIQNSGSPIDYSSVGTNKYIYLTDRGTNSSNNTNRVYVYNIRRITGSETTSLIKAFSNDEGSNYVTLSNGVADTSSNTGLSGRVKVSGTVSSGELMVVKNCDFQVLLNSEVQ